VPILTAAEAASLVMDYDSCLKSGTMLGSGGIMVMNETTSMPRVALRAIRFYAHESCGQCTPCRQGSHAVAALLERLVAGRGEAGDIDRVLDLCRRVKGTTLCPTGEAFAVPSKPWSPSSATNSRRSRAEPARRPARAPAPRKDDVRW